MVLVNQRVVRSIIVLIWILTDVSFYLVDVIIIKLVFAVFIDRLFTSHHSFTFSSSEFTRTWEGIEVPSITGKTDDWDDRDD